MAGTFGAGLPHACVVDVGDQKTSISCVEDGISHVDTRVSMLLSLHISIACLFFHANLNFLYKIIGSSWVWRRGHIPGSALLNEEV